MHMHAYLHWWGAVYLETPKSHIEGLSIRLKERIANWSLRETCTARLPGSRGVPTWQLGGTSAQPPEGSTKGSLGRLAEACINLLS